MKSTRNLNHLLRFSTTQAIDYTKVYAHILIVGKNCSNYNHFQLRHSFTTPIISVQCAHILCRGNYIYISSRHTFLTKISTFRFVDPFNFLNTIVIYNNIIIMLLFFCSVMCSTSKNWNINSAGGLT